jgi:glycosyltransferase involved in cell wall biosynthesis
LPTDEDARRSESPLEEGHSDAGQTPPSLVVSGETAYPISAPGSRVRVARYVPFLAEHGIDLRYLPSLSPEEYAEIASDASTARKARVTMRSAIRLARQSAHDGLVLVYRLRSLAPVPGLDAGRRIDVYDFDDALFASAGSRGTTRGWIKRERQRCRAYASRARLVLTGNAYLADWARRYAKRVEVVPSCVDPWEQPLKTHQEADVVTVGWIGSRSTGQYLDQVLPVFEKLNARKPTVKLLLIGAGERFDAPWIEQRPWRLQDEPDVLTEIDIGIMPLSDDEWTRGKCGYKLLQYFSAGIPAVASPVGINKRLVDDGRGLLATSPKDWGSALEALAGDTTMRAEMGARARAFAEEEFSYRRWAPELAALLKSVG